jgi:hypothetical protein
LIQIKVQKVHKFNFNFFKVVYTLLLLKMYFWNSKDFFFLFYTKLFKIYIFWPLTLNLTYKTGFVRGISWFFWKSFIQALKWYISFLVPKFIAISSFWCEMQWTAETVVGSCHTIYRQNKELERTIKYIVWSRTRRNV